MAEKSGTSSGVQSGSGVVLSKTNTKGGNTRGNSFKLITADFNRTNYLEWSKSAKITLSGKRKIWYVNGKIKPPPEDDPTYNEWEAADGVFTSWLLKSMEQYFQDNVLKISKVIWDGVATSYLQKKD